MPLLSQDIFVLRSDKTNPGVMECHCSVCQRLVAASRDMDVLEIVQRIHLEQVASGNADPAQIYDVGRAGAQLATQSAKFLGINALQ